MYFLPKMMLQKHTAAHNTLILESLLFIPVMVTIAV